jgi:DNA polymerase (family 10)
VEIRSDGELDYPFGILTLLDIVGASVHSGMKQTREQITGRILRALQGRVDILNHPTGRLLQKRPAYEVDLDRVMDIARMRGVALEVNGNPDRLDLNDVNARRAIGKGLFVTLDTDAHSVEGLDLMRFAVATARRGWIERRDVLNALSREELIGYLLRHHKAA